MNERFLYPARFEPEGDALNVSFRDLPEALTFGVGEADAREQAADCLEEAIAGRIRRNEDIPIPSAAAPGEHGVAVPVITALKAALYLALREQGISQSELARRLGVDEKEVRRFLDPRYGTKAPALERALRALGKRADVRVA